MELTIDHISKSFGDNQVLKDISLHIQSGKPLGLLGRNGAGKTTSIRIIMGVFLADEGKVLLDGKPFKRKDVKIGYLPEERGLYPKKKISEQLVYLAELKGMPKKEAKHSYEELLERLGMSQYADTKLETLSKGNQQKIQLIATLINKPDIIILDEPFSGLDPVNAMLLKDIIKELIDDGKIVLFSSHQMNYIEEFCDEIAILNKGKIVLSGDIRKIRRSYDRRVVIVSGERLEAIASYANEHLSHLAESAQVIDETVRIALKEESMKTDLFTGLSEAGLEIDGLHIYEPTLNDIFVEYTERAI